MDLHDTSVSKSLLQVRNAYSDEPSDHETWTDFLRNTSSTQPRANMDRPTHTDELSTATSDAHAAPSQRKRVASITHSAERKRSSGAFSQFSGIPGTRGYPIDLTSSPHQSSLSYNDSAQCLSTAQSERGNSSIVLPPWQADSDVDACPVCKDQFSWYFRKHHCRKCGKVVCANCSQHRITMPQQYIVQAPPHEQTAATLLDGRSSNAVSGETVRVCNPCVPDPNCSLPPQDHDLLLRRNSYDGNVRGRLPRGDTSQLVSAAQVASRYRSSPSQSLRLNSGHGNQHYHSRTHRSAFSSSVIPSTATIPHTPADFLQASYSQRRSTVSSGLGPPQHHMIDPSARVLSHTNALYGELPTSESPEQPYLSRVQLAEEDECPVCGHELPTHTASDDDAARARHIDECIRSYGSLPARSNLPAAPRSTPDVPSFTRLTTDPNAQGTLDAVIASARSLTPSLTSSSAQIALTYAVPATSLQRRAPRMLDYKASEKDCVDDRGEQQECVICFEEFEVGDNMGRLECLCKFHRKCIVGWWRAKDVTNANSRTSGGQGSAGCPTHVLQI